MKRDDCFGCEVCNATPLDETKRDDLPFQPVRRLHESSHSGFTLCKCSSCGQHYLQQFHEIVDWADGNDDIWVRWEPLTEEEVSKLDYMFPGEYYDSSSWNVLIDFMHLRCRLVWGREGRFYWSEHPWDAGDMMPPG